MINSAFTCDIYIHIGPNVLVSYYTIKHYAGHVSIDLLISIHVDVNLCLKDIEITLAIYPDSTKRCCLHVTICQVLQEPIV